MSSAPADLSAVLRARLCVAYLGETTAQDWWEGAWRSNFLNTASLGAYLGAIMPRTALAGGMRSACMLAAQEHDAGKVGVPGVFHLFRFPVDWEERLAIRLAEFANPEARKLIAEIDQAKAALARIADTVKVPTTAKGPWQVGQDGPTEDCLARMVAGYLAAFDRRTPIYPYFAVPRV
jgi:hypothetical protein